MAERTVESVAAELQKLTGNSLYGTRLAAAAGYALRCERAALERAAGEMEFYARSSDDLGDRVGASAHRGDAALLRRLAAEGIDRRASGEPTDGEVFFADHITAMRNLETCARGQVPGSVWELVTALVAAAEHASLEAALRRTRERAEGGEES